MLKKCNQNLSEIPEVTPFTHSALGGRIASKPAAIRKLPNNQELYQ